MCKKTKMFKDWNNLFNSKNKIYKNYIKQYVTDILYMLDKITEILEADSGLPESSSGNNIDMKV